MKLNRSYIFVILTVVVLLASCELNQKKTHGPIVLGDSSTIVTETDSQYLKDFVADFKPTIPAETATPDTTHPATAPGADTTTKSQPAATTTPVQPDAGQGQGLTVTFNEVTVFIPGITTKTYRNQDPKKGNGASYQLTGGNLNNGQLKVIGNVTKVSQHYQTVVILKNSLGTLSLDALSNTTEWTALKGSNTIYTISGLDANKLEYSDADGAEIRKAVEKALRTHHINRRKHAEWMNSVRRVNSVKQAPLKVVLKNVVWKIEGKDANGKLYQKQLRLDLPY